MASTFTPWEPTSNSGELSGDLSSFEISNDMESDMPEHGDAMAQALSVISQQSQLIGRLMDMLGGSPQ